MSTILKALRRLEREKQPQTERPLRDDVVALHPGEPQEGPDRTLWWTSRVGVAFILVLGSLWLASGMREVGHESAGTRPLAEVARPDARVSGAVAPVPSRVRRAEEQPAPAAANLPSPRTPTPPRAVPGEMTPAKSAPAALERPRRVAVRAPERSHPVAERPRRLPDPEPLHAFEAPTVRAATPPRAGGAGPQEAALTPEPEAFVAKPIAEPKAPPGPEAHVDSTTWHPDAARRLAVVSTPDRGEVTLREGDAIGELVVLRIEPAAVVFLYEGREVSRRVGE
jgi:hypothetical protein